MSQIPPLAVEIYARTVAAELAERNARRRRGRWRRAEPPPAYPWHARAALDAAVALDRFWELNAPYFCPPDPEAEADDGMDLATDQGAGAGAGTYQEAS